MVSSAYKNGQDDKLYWYYAQDIGGVFVITQSNAFHIDFSSEYEQVFVPLAVFPLLESHDHPMNGVAGNNYRTVLNVDSQNAMKEHVFFLSSLFKY